MKRPATEDTAPYDTATNTLVATIPVGTIPFAVAVTPDGTHVYVTNDGSNNVSVIGTATNAVVKTIPGGRTPLASPSPPMGHTSTSRMRAPAVFR